MDDVLSFVKQRAAEAADAERPHVTLTWAQSLDGSISARAGSQLILSGTDSMRMTHALRAMHDAILVGIGTLLADNPSLNVRHVQGDNPLPVVLDSQLRTPLSCNLLTSPKCRRPLLAAVEPSAGAAGEWRARREALEAAGASVVVCRAAGEGRVDLGDLLGRLRARGARSVMVEGGAAVISALLALPAPPVDALVVTLAPTLVGGLKAVSGLLPSDGRGRFPRLAPPRYAPLGEDLVVYGPLSPAPAPAQAP